MGCPVHNRGDDVPADRVHSFNYLSGEGMATDPWTVLHDFSTEGPNLGFFWTPELGGHWCATRREIVVDILRDSNLFSTHNIRVPKVNRAVPSIPHHLDPPEHGKYRISVVEMFGHRVLDELTPSIRQTIQTLAAELETRGEAEFVYDVALRVPVEIFIRMCGLPMDRRDEMVGWVKDYFHGTREASHIAHQTTVEFLGGWLDEQLQHPGITGGHIMPSLLKTRVDGRPLTREEMMSIIITLFNGGLDTVAAQMTHIFRFLAENPQARQRLIDDPAKIPDAVEEMLRRFSIISIGREVKRDAVYQGVNLRQGDMVLCMISAAGLDEADFPHAMQVDFDRPNRRQHCAFGSGHHMCVGAPLARLELRILLEELLPRLPNFRLRPGASLAYHSGVTLGLVDLPVQWDRTAPAT